MLDALLKLVLVAQSGMDTFYQNDGEESLEYWQNHPNHSISNAAMLFMKTLNNETEDDNAQMSDHQYEAAFDSMLKMNYRKEETKQEFTTQVDDIFGHQTSIPADT